MKNYPLKYRIASDGQLYYLQKRITFLTFTWWRTILVDTKDDAMFNHLKQTK